MTENTREARTEAVRALENEFSGLIHQFRRIITENANRVAPGMLPGAYKVFTIIARCERVTASALAEDLLIDKGQLSRTVRELEELGLIERHRDPHDGRAILLSPTALGTQRLEDARAPQEHMLMQALADWPVEEIRSLSRLLHALTAGALPEPTESAG